MRGDFVGNKKQHLSYIQEVINRMARNSFALKGWVVSLIVGILVLARDKTDKTFFLLAYIPIIVFWGLDSYYLLQERLYRSLYNKVRLLKEEDIDYDMRVSQSEHKYPKNTFRSCLFSKTEFWFYMPLCIALSIIVILTFCL